MATYNFGIRLWVAAICTASLLFYFFVIPALYRPLVQEGLHRIFVATAAVVALVAVRPVLRRGTPSQRLRALLLLLLPATALIYALSWLIRTAF